MGLHSVTFHLAKVTFLPFRHLKLVLEKQPQKDAKLVSYLQTEMAHPPDDGHPSLTVLTGSYVG